MSEREAELQDFEVAEPQRWEPLTRRPSTYLALFGVTLPIGAIVERLPGD